MGLNNKRLLLDLSEFIYCSELLVVVFMLVNGILGRTALVSSLLAVNYILVAGLLVCLFLEKKVYERSLFFSFVIILSLSFFSMWYYGSLSFSYARKWLMFFCVISLYFWVYNTHITKRMISATVAFGIVLAVIFAIAFLAGYTYPLGIVGITFNLGNPNFTGMWLLCVFALLVLEIEFFEKKAVKLVLAALAILIFYFLLRTNARGSILPAMCFLPLRLLYRRNNPLITVCVVISPLVFALVYLAYINNESLVEFFSFLVSEGKPLDSRVSIWQRGLELFAEYPLLGNYYKSTDGSGVSQYHNIYVDTLCTYGAVVQVAIIVFLTRILNGISRKSRDTGLALGANIAFYLVIVSGWFEAGLFASSQGVYVVSATLLLLGRYERHQYDL